MRYEYGIIHKSDISSVISDSKTHRSKMTEHDASQWIEEWISLDGKADSFFKIKRLIFDWEKIENEEDGSENYEYGLIHKSEVINGITDENLHRKGMTKEEMETWLSDWVTLDGKPDSFIKIKRKIQPWELIK